MTANCFRGSVPVHQSLLDLNLAKEVIHVIAFSSGDLGDLRRNFWKLFAQFWSRKCGQASLWFGDDRHLMGHAKLVIFWGASMYFPIHTGSEWRIHDHWQISQSVLLHNDMAELLSFQSFRFIRHGTLPEQSLVINWLLVAPPNCLAGWRDPTTNTIELKTRGVRAAQGSQDQTVAFKAGWRQMGLLEKETSKRYSGHKWQKKSIMTWTQLEPTSNNIQYLKLKLWWVLSVLSPPQTSAPNFCLLGAPLEVPPRIHAAGTARCIAQTRTEKGVCKLSEWDTNPPNWMEVQNDATLCYTMLHWWSRWSHWENPIGIIGLSKSCLQVISLPHRHLKPREPDWAVWDYPQLSVTKTETSQIDLDRV